VPVIVIVYVAGEVDVHDSNAVAGVGGTVTIVGLTALQERPEGSDP